MLTPILSSEKKIQLYDKTRFDAQKSFAVKGAAAITGVEIRPGLDAAYISVFNSDPRQWFLDYAFVDFNADLDTTNNYLKIYQGSTAYTLSLAPGNYSLAAILSTLETQFQLLDPLATFGLNADNEVELNSNLDFRILSKGLAPYLGFLYDTVLAKKAQGWPVEKLPKIITLKLTNGVLATTLDYRVDLYSVEGDKLFSGDGDLLAEEPEILSWVTKGRATFIDVHRRAQAHILDYLDRNGFRALADGKPGQAGDPIKINKWHLPDNSDVILWSAYAALNFIYAGIENAKDDFFKRKADYYDKKQIEARNRALISLDLRSDKKPEAGVGPQLSTGRLRMR